jgi:hypothetical protein
MTGAQHIPPSCPAKAGHPAIIDSTIDNERRGVLDHPLARVMTLTGFKS